MSKKYNYRYRWLRSKMVMAGITVEDIRDEYQTAYGRRCSNVVVYHVLLGQRRASKVESIISRLLGCDINIIQKDDDNEK